MLAGWMDGEVRLGLNLPTEGTPWTNLPAKFHADTAIRNEDAYAG
jgi:hypothetical protein